MAFPSETGLLNHNQHVSATSNSLPVSRAARDSFRSRQLNHEINNSSGLPQSLENRRSAAYLNASRRPTHLRSHSDHIQAPPNLVHPIPARNPPSPLDLTHSKALMQVRNHSAYPMGLPEAYPASISSRSPPAFPPRSASTNSLPDSGRARDFNRTGSGQPYSAYPGLEPPKSRLNPNRQSTDRPRSTAYPTNLLKSAPGMTYSSRPLSVAALEPERIVTGILQSALPINSRPVQAPTKPAQSMSIHELEERHKFALQRLQRKTNQSLTKEETKARGVAVAAQANRKPLPRRQSNPQKAEPEIIEAPESPPEVVKSQKTRRKSFFGFFTSKTAPAPVVAPGIINSRELSLIENSKEIIPADDNSADDEDVPLAQLRQSKPFRRSQTTGDLNHASKPNKTAQSPHGKASGGKSMSQNLGNGNYNAPTKVGDQRKIQRSKLSQTVFEVVQEQPDGEMVGDLTYNSRQPLPLPTYSNPNAYGITHSMSHDNLRRNLNSQYIGPRPAIFEEEARALRNSKRYSLAPKITVESFENQPLPKTG